VASLVPEIGYVQGMGFIIAYLLLTFDKAGQSLEEAENNALSSFIGLVDRLNLRNLYTERMTGLKCSLGVLEVLL
jgi:hypothetical protein